MISIAIDGPAGVGKSTISQIIAKKLGWHCLDTGAIYRAIAYRCVQKNADIDNEGSIMTAMNDCDVRVAFENGLQKTYINNQDVTSFLRSSQMDYASSRVAVFKSVRDSVIELQRGLAKKENIVVEGRDIGSYVLKETKNKFFLTATPEERANRRYSERISKGIDASYLNILEEIKRRDRQDRERKIAPLVVAEDAILIDTTSLSINKVVEEIMKNLVLKD